MTPAEVTRYLNNCRTEISVRSKDGFTYKGAHVGYFERGGSNGGILVATSEADGGETVEVLYSKIKTIDPK